MYHQIILEMHPSKTIKDRRALLNCIDECWECAASCVACADITLSQVVLVDMLAVLRLCLDCADTCYTTGRVLARQTAADKTLIRAVLQACISACIACADECERHAEKHPHCRICANACRRCQRACDELLAVLD